MRDEVPGVPDAGLEVDLRRRSRAGPPPAVILTDANGIITYWSAGAERLLGWPAEDLLHRSVEEITSSPNAGVRADQLRAGLTSQASSTGEYVLQRRDGTEVPILITTDPIVGASGSAIGTVSVAVDLSDRVQAEHEARTRAAQMTAVAAVGELAVTQTSLSALLDGALRQALRALDADLGTVLMLDEDGLRLVASVGVPPDLIDSRPVPTGTASLAGYTLEQDDPVLVEDLARDARFVAPPLLVQHGVVSGVTSVLRVGGQGVGVLSVYTTTPRVFGQDEVNVLRSIANVLAHAVERERAQQQLSRIAITDELTGLPNRVLFVDRLEQALGHQEVGTVAVAFGDVDGFKEVNEAFGHAAGDELLRVTARRLAACRRDGDTVARFGGDEFAMLFEGVAGPEEAAALARELSQAVAGDSVVVEGRELPVSISLGVVVADPGAEVDAAALLRDADAAMYRAKSAGRGHVELFDRDQGESVLQRLDRTNALRRAISEGELVVHYQPEIGLATGDVWCEALVRWQHPEHGLLMPADFVELAEETGLIGALGEAVLVQAAEQLARWASAEPGTAPAAVSVNISARQLVDGGLVSLTADLLDALSLDPASLWFELTETAILRQPERSIETLQALKDLGVGLAIDDFGTGYSSLTYARLLPIDGIKIDRSFITGMATDPRDEGIVRATVGLARSFGILSIAEGVETSDQLERLREMGCDFAQGYLLCRPAPAATIEDWLRDRPQLP